MIQNKENQAMRTELTSFTNNVLLSVQYIHEHVEKYGDLRTMRLNL